ncbi:MAG TPA: relaxase MobL, partial [Pyrinomonadaceae bacterium]|nr:relaxase MobL [Pyrinomonadaceae bacterium]
MRIIASVQSKRGSSRGLVHYLAHSKIDPDKEPEKGRELFNAFTDQLDVRNANNFLKSNCGKGRPTNDELHHLVLSFRPEDFQGLGSTDDVRKRRLKAVSRFAMSQLEKSLNSERLAWAGAVHLNTANPHLHIAIQKNYLTKDLRAQSLNKIPREALPHFESINGEKQIVEGIFIESAQTKLEELIAVSGASQKHVKDQNSSRTNEKTIIENNGRNSDERETLRLGILAEYQLKFKEERIAFLVEHRQNLRFPVSDPKTGVKHKVSIRELELASSGLSGLDNTVEARQIRAITHSILAKEESEFFKLKEDTAEVRKETDQIRKNHKKSGTKLPAPAFSKKELDDLQDQCLVNSNVREYRFLEQIRLDLENRNEIQPRDTPDLERLTAQKILSELRLQHRERKLMDFRDNAYYRKASVGKEQISLAMIDRESKAKDRTNGSVIQSIRVAIQSLTNKETLRYSKSNKSQLTGAVNNSLNEQSMGIQKDLQTCRKVVGVLHDVLDRHAIQKDLEPRFSAEEVLEIDVLARRLNLPKEYSANWNLQKHLISEFEGLQDNKGRTDTSPKLAETSDLIAGRAIAREVLCNIDLNKAKEALGYYRKSKRFHKFMVEDKANGKTGFLSLNDVDLPRKGSTLDHALNFLLENKDRRVLRRELEARIHGRERNLKAAVAAAKEFFFIAGEETAEFKHLSLWSSVNKPTYVPILTTSEITEIEKRIEFTSSRKEGKRLTLILQQSKNVNKTFIGVFSLETLMKTGKDRVLSGREKE